MRSQSTDPFVNLATEDWIFSDVSDPTTKHVLYFWRNDKTVVIGKHQNPWKECHIQRMEQDGVVLARRRSGGGAVYQDLGNSIFTFLSPRDLYDKTVNFQILTNALKYRFDIDAQLSGRNDVVVNIKDDHHRDGDIDGQAPPPPRQCKVSGSAFKVGRDRSFHHGTMLVDVDMDALSNYLNPNKLKLASKGIASVKSRVINLKDLNPEVNHDTLREAIIEQFCKAHGVDPRSCEVEDVDLDTLQHNAEWKRSYDGLRDWDWRFGHSPAFTHNFETRFDWGMVDVHLECASRSQVSQCKIYSDTLHPLLVEHFEQCLQGVTYSREGVLGAATRVKQQIEAAMREGNSSPEDVKMVQGYADEMAAWIVSNL